MASKSPKPDKKHLNSKITAEVKRILGHHKEHPHTQREDVLDVNNIRLDNDIPLRRSSINDVSKTSDLKTEKSANAGDASNRNLEETTSARSRSGSFKELCNDSSNVDYVNSNTSAIDKSKDLESVSLYVQNLKRPSEGYVDCGGLNPTEMSSGYKSDIGSSSNLTTTDEINVPMDLRRDSERSTELDKDSGMSQDSGKGSNRDGTSCSFDAMDPRHNSSSDNDDDIVEGWLHVWEVDHDLENHVFCAGRHPLPRWDPKYCLISSRSSTITFYEAEEDSPYNIDESEEIQCPITLTPPATVSIQTDPVSRVQTRVRLDGGKGHFERRWGYKSLRREPKPPPTPTLSIHDTDSEGLGQLQEESDADTVFEDPSAESFFRARTNLDIHQDLLSDSSLERVDGGTDRRGSLPLVTSPYSGGGGSMESVSTTSKLASFFSKKGFKTNLKRTKSATKLDRKQSSPNLASDNNDTSSLMGSLKRTMSLGRLNRKKKGTRGGSTNPDPYGTPVCGRAKTQQPSAQQSSTSSSQNPTPHGSPALSLLNARLRSSRSHESLLASPASMHSIDLSAPDVEVKPLHSSVLGQGHCFHVATAQGSKYISCTTSEERDKWLSSLRRTIRPHEEHSRRSDCSLKLWVVEAKNVAAKKRYFCDILLDRTLYAQTSVKTMTDMLFWGEHFEFKNLPAVEIITVNLYREADKKKKKDKNTLVGYINLSIADIENRQMVERWITCSSGTVGKAGKESKNDLPIIRLKARRQTVEILPMDAYQTFIKYLTNDYKELCELFEPLLSVKVKEDFATCLVHILQKQGKACHFLTDIILSEISRLDDEHLTFRGNSIATKAMEAYMKLVGEKYLQDTLGDFIRQMIQSTDDCEVDPTKVATPQLLSCQQKNLDMYANMAWVKITNSFCYFPNELREVFSTLRSRCGDLGKAEYCDNLISGCIFLRFLCPAILYPSLFNLTQEYPQERASRNLTLIAKTLQTLANFTQFGGKEEFMIFMNAFIEREESNMKTFLHKISSRDAGNQFLEYDGYIDLGKELSVLHCLLLDCMEKVSQTSDPKFEQLNNILNQVSNAFDDPTIGQKKTSNRRSQIYDNLMSVPSAGKEPPKVPNQITYGPARVRNMAASSPTEVLIDMLMHCGESADDLPALANRGKQSDQQTSSGENTAAGSSLTLTGVSKSSSEDISSFGPDQHGMYSENRLNASWTKIVNAAENLNGDYIDLIPFMDEDTQNSSMELEANTTGSQVSIGQVSTVASSGYQSFSHGQSQSNSPVDAGVSQGQGSSAGATTQPTENVRELSKSPVVQYQPRNQPLAFANPLFRHQQQQLLQQQRMQQQQQHQTGSLGSHAGMQLQQARTVRRPSSDSSLSSEDGVEGKDDSQQTGNMKEKVKTVVSSDYRSTIAPLKKLSQLSSSSSDDESLSGQNSTADLISGMSTSQASAQHQGNFVHSSSSNFISPSSSTPQSSSSGSSVQSSSLSNSALNGCSTFPRRHRQQQDKNNGNEVSPPLPPREAIGGNAAGSQSRSSRPQQSGNKFYRQQSLQSYGSGSGGVSAPQAPQRPMNRAGITTNQSGHVQQRSRPGDVITGPSPAIPPRGVPQSTSTPASYGSSYSGSPAVSHRLVGSTTSSPGSPRHASNNNHPKNNLTSTSASSISSLSSSMYSSSGQQTPSSHQQVTNWQMAQHMERRSSSSQEATSSSTESSPPSLIRSSAQQSLRESSSAHSMSSAMPWGTPSHSDSNSSLSSLTKLHQRAPVRSDSSGSIGTGNHISRISQTPSDSNSSVSSGNNNNTTFSHTPGGSGLSSPSLAKASSQLDNISNLTQIRPYQGHSNPSSFNARLVSQSDSQIHTSSLSQPPPPSFLSSAKYSVVHPPVPVSGSHHPSSVGHGSLSIDTLTSEPRSGYPPSRSMDLTHLSKQQSNDPLKRASTDSSLGSQPMSPTGPAPSIPRDDSSHSLSSNASNRRLSPQSAVHMGISSVQRKLQEQERTKMEYEQEVHVLRQQLLEAQGRLHQAEIRLLDHEDDTHKLMDEWRSRLTESEEKMRRQQAEKDEQMKAIIGRLQSIEEELKREQSEMASAVEHKQQVIEVQEQRIRSLDQANQKLLQALTELKGRAALAAAQGEDQSRNGSSYNGIAVQKEVAGFKTSSC